MSTGSFCTPCGPSRRRSGGLPRAAPAGTRRRPHRARRWLLHSCGRAPSASTRANDTLQAVLNAGICLRTSYGLGLVYLAQNRQGPLLRALASNLGSGPLCRSCGLTGRPEWRNRPSTPCSSEIWAQSPACYARFHCETCTCSIALWLISHAQSLENGPSPPTAPGRLARPGLSRLQVGPGQVSCSYGGFAGARQLVNLGALLR